MLLQIFQIQKLWVLHLPDFPQRLTGRSTRTLPLRGTVRPFRAAQAAPVNSVR